MSERSSKIFVVIEWLATVTLVAGVALTSFNIFPLNIYISLVGNLLWFIMGVHWKKWSLIVIQIFITIIYGIGIIKYFFVDI